MSSLGFRSSDTLGSSPEAPVAGNGPAFSGLPRGAALYWLVRLRWVAVVGQLAALAVGSAALELALPLPDLLGVVALEAASILLLPALGRRAGARIRALFVATLALDLVLLTALLALAGGPASHFSVLYLLPISLAALVLGSAWGWIAVAASSLCYASLFLVTRPLPHVHDEDHGLGVHILGMWIATALAAIVIATVVGRIATALRAREQELRALEARTQRNERLVALGTLAAGAAHELGTPLATIAVAARELERSASARELERSASARELERSASAREGERDAAGAGVDADARLIREQVERCREILIQMSAAAGAASGEALEPLGLEDLFRAVEQSLAPDVRERVEQILPEVAPALVAPRASLVRAVTHLVSNALDASPPPGRVRLSAEPAGDRLRLVVRDEGSGMPPEVLARAGEPFFTTKPAGSGQGLGLFLARAVAQQLGGGLALASQAGVGTTATLEIGLRPGAEGRRP